MSDLISRSELIEEIKSLSIVLNGKQIFSDDAKDTVLRIINEQPTAYSVDKVVEELESEKRYGSKYDSYYEENLYHGEMFENDVNNKTIDKAIEIVKQGCVYDDVCEWKQDKGCVGLGAYNISCCSKTLEMPVSTARGLKYCPYCSKKIKVVE